jgi:hypothetical protein
MTQVSFVLPQTKTHVVMSTICVATKRQLILRNYSHGDFVNENQHTQNKPVFSSSTTTMSSASQIDHATMSEDQLAEMLSKVKSLRETEALRARLPALLAPFASNISIIEPIQTVCTSPPDGVHCSSCKVKERRIWMSVAVVPSPHSQSQDSGATCEAFGTRLARLADKFEVSHRNCRFRHAFYFPPIRSSSWNAFEGDCLYRLVRRPWDT